MEVVSEPRVLAFRLGREGTEPVVVSHQIACSHFDAYRFFTPAARPRNVLSPTRAEQAAYEQPWRLHAGMDLHKRHGDSSVRAEW